LSTLLNRHLVLTGIVLALCVGCPDGTGEADAGSEPAEDTRFVQFPADFSWGTAVAQWQVQGDQSSTGGDPIASNWSEWMSMGKGRMEQQNPVGNGFLTQYEEDFDRAKELGLDTFRLGVDWARIEPTPGVFDEGEMNHVVNMLEALQARGLRPVLTLWHWTVPLWVQNPNPDHPDGYVDMIASEDRAIVDRFEAFVREVIPRVKEYVDIYTVLNEPFSMVSAGYVGAVFPPGKFLDIDGGTQFLVNLAFMHARAFDVIKELDDIDADGDGQESFIGLTQTANLFYPIDPENEAQIFASERTSYVFNDVVMNALTRGELDVDLDGAYTSSDTVPPEGEYEELKNRLEFIGVQYYGPVVMKDDPLFIDYHPLYGYPLLEVEDYDETLPHNGMGRQISATGFRDTIELYAQWDLPIILTENGTTTNGVPVEDDEGLIIDLPNVPDQAAMYLVEHLWEVAQAIKRGVDIRGYYHWTLADNYEWVEGRYQRFGAYTVDWDDAELPRTLSRMGEALQDVVQAGEINEAIWNEYVQDRYSTDTSSAGGLTISGKDLFD
jgi:beta-glucosidase